VGEVFTLAKKSFSVELKRHMYFHFPRDPASSLGSCSQGDTERARLGNLGHLPA
jgi:hypothetical protein